MSFFPEPLKLQDFPRASSAFPSSPGAAASSPSPRDCPSPNKKRRVGSVPPVSTGGSAGKPKSTSSTSSSWSSRAARLAEDQKHAEERLRSTLRLQDAWADIERRHSLSSSFSDSPFASSGAPAPPSLSRSRRHNPAGWTRALPVEVDDIIDLSTMEIVEDRGVLRSSRAGAFAIGGYAGTFDDVIVGPDTGGGSTGDDGEEGDEEEEEVDWEEPDEGASDTDDELGAIDDLPSLPSLLFREERRKDAERKKELEAFWAQEARSRGQTEEAHRNEDVEVTEGNFQLSQPLRASLQQQEEDELGLFASPEPPSSSCPTPAVTPSRHSRPVSNKPPPSTTAGLRQAVQTIHLDSSPSSSSSAGTDPSPTHSPAKCTTKRSSPSLGISTPPNSLTRESSMSSRTRAQSKPRSSSSPLKNVVTIPSRSISPELGFPPPRSISPELGIFRTPSTSACHHPTPTPTPPPQNPSPPPPASSISRPSVPPRSRKKRPQFFELVIEVPPSRARAKSCAAEKPANPVASSAAKVKPKAKRTPRPPAPTVKKQSLPTSKSLPNLASSAAAPSSPQSKKPEERTTIVIEVHDSSDEEGAETRAEKRKQADEDAVFETGLSTPPLSKGASRRFSSGSLPPPPSASMRSPSRPPPSKSKGKEKAKEPAEEEEDDDPLLLSSPIKVHVSPAKAATPRPPSVAPTGEGAKGEAARKRRMSLPPAFAVTTTRSDGDTESEDELMMM
ncbi:hypothetical protein JCM8547_006760 [Rhodosporidiobolus lusitaniae]